MCGTCGCGSKAETRILNLQTGEETALSDVHGHSHAHDGGMAHRHSHDHDHGHVHPHDHGEGDGHDHQHPHSHGHDHTHGHEHGHEHASEQAREHRHDDVELHGHDYSHEHDHHGHDHADGHHHHGHEHRHGHTAVVELEMQILAKNDALAASNRGWFAGREILALNLVSSPGSGKTTLLERTIGDLKDQMLISVIEGDQATANDGERIRAAGADAIQVNTGAGCHLEADMLAKGLLELKPAFGSVVMIENVGNLVCPAMFDLGEHAKVVILSVTEGDDKPLKYPHMFRAAKVMIINKIDLLAHVDFDVDSAIANACLINPEIVTLSVSAKTGEGLGGWYEWLHQEAAQVRL
ncbi:hydrogenase nickel incorporation protein HypB [Mesorhizobium sp. WSM4307]|uniref:hydrogenase nickel incorporation protein HypB n=1 Tax=unclassified Mesorhizobium TaxID=325217 RepID=UPI000BB09D32|nr:MULTISPECIES: hydrogenase nickel incorporation protein HypB [unclassified Mesorhizobium]PBB24445.1 hydrogenase accessory protein HypB [Mesorhizobium sp. WSM4304]PBB74587.1 hydrogenase accessory protein HypB [Mesorhizobium sp. WSM4308]TRC73246.1 hydrogenase nickel incorporation protein HypB [Mesorhizobium sp. WSM4315]TRC83525.1 hydrogenase nickel incorporation protein HypB [Mesorhizobium sp. WSM4307]